jgi:hypothetical protein
MSNTITKQWTQNYLVIFPLQSTLYINEKHTVYNTASPSFVMVVYTFRLFIDQSKFSSGKNKMST